MAVKELSILLEEVWRAPSWHCPDPVSNTEETANNKAAQVANCCKYCTQ